MVVRNLILCVLLIGLTVTIQASTGDLQSCVARSYRGQLNAIVVVPNSQPPQVPVGQLQSPDTLDVEGMAKWSLQYLRNNVHSEGDHGFATWFAINLLPEGDALPVRPWWGDGLDGDTEVRMLRAFLENRKIIGMALPDAQEAGLLDTVMGYAQGDLYNFESRQAAIVTGTSWLIGICADRYAATGESVWKETGQRLQQGLAGQSVWERGNAWFKCITVNPAGDCREQNIYGPLGWAEPSLRLWQTTHDEQALSYASAIANALVSGAQPVDDPATLFGPGGAYYGQVWSHIFAALGVLDVGLETGNAGYVNWAKKIYDYSKSLGNDTGWVPEWQGTGTAGLGQAWWGTHSDHAETCGVAEMAEMAACLGKAGYGECFDDLERIVRNYLRWVQFFVTPEYEALYRQRNPNTADEGLAITRCLQGGFVASPEINDLFNSTATAPGAFHPGIDMMGCCPARGVHALYEAWSSIITTNDEGVFVNMSLNRDTPDLKVVSYAPQHGRITVVAKRSFPAVFIRPPSWSPREMTAGYRSGVSVPVDWRADYIRFENVGAQEELTITYPVVSFAQTLTIAKNIAGKEKTVTQNWEGNTLVTIQPAGTVLPLYSGTPPVLPALPTVEVPTVGHVWNAASDWSDAANPNGCWSYGSGTDDRFEMINNHVPQLWNWQDQGGWAKGQWEAIALAKLVYDRRPWQDFAPGDTFVHADAMVRWTSPVWGRVRVNCTGWMGYNHDGVRLEYWLLENGDWNGNSPQQRHFVGDITFGVHTRSNPASMECEFNVRFGQNVQLLVRKHPADAHSTLGGYTFGVELLDIDDAHAVPEILCVPSPQADYNGDCQVNILDFAIFAESWLESGI